MNFLIILFLGILYESVPTTTLMTDNVPLEFIVENVICGRTDPHTGTAPHARHVEKPVNAMYTFYCCDSRRSDCPHHVVAGFLDYCAYKPKPEPKKGSL